MNLPRLSLPTLRRYAHGGTYLARFGPDVRDLLGCGRVGKLSREDRAFVEDDGTAPPVTPNQQGWEDGWAGLRARNTGTGYARGWKDGRACRGRRVAVDRARLLRTLPARMHT